MKRLILPLFLLLAPAAYAGTFTKTGGSHYKFEGAIEFWDVPAFKEIAGRHTELTLEIDSPGGSLYASLELGEFTRSIASKVTVIVGETYSGASVWALGATKWSYRDDRSFLAFHLPWSVAEIPGDEWMYHGWRYGSFLERCLGAYSADRLMLDMLDVRGRLGINAFIVWSKNDAPRKGLWTRDGWKWDDGGTSPKALLEPKHIRP